ncbi:hypothetical protein POUND7_008108 [Theobroma cacao]
MDRVFKVIKMYYQNLDFGDLSNSQSFVKAGKYADLQTVIFNCCALHSRLPFAVSAGGVVASILVVPCLFWVGLVDQVGFHNKGTTLNLASLPVAVGLYGYCYSGHAVFPNIYTSMAKPNQFPSVLLACFGICSLLYTGTAIMGYAMFVEATESQFTLSMPKDLIASKIAVWTTVVNPFTKYPFYYSSLHCYLESAY